MSGREKVEPSLRNQCQGKVRFNSFNATQVLLRTCPVLSIEGEEGKAETMAVAHTVVARGHKLRERRMKGDLCLGLSGPDAAAGYSGSAGSCSVSDTHRCSYMLSALN